MPANRHVLLALILSASASACGSPLLPEGSPTTTGSILSFAITSPSATRIFEVGASPSDPCPIGFTIVSDTRIFVRSDDIRRGQLSDLQLGARVSVWAEGAVTGSCPGRAAAGAVEVLE